MSEALPTTNEQFYTEFQPSIARLVRQRVDQAQRRPDVLGELWVRLLAADVLGKFYASTTDALPATRGRLRAYVRKAATRKLSNIFRTYRARFSREFPHDKLTNSDGDHRDNWEDTLPSRTITPERFCIVMSNTRLRWTVIG